MRCRLRLSIEVIVFFFVILNFPQVGLLSLKFVLGNSKAWNLHALLFASLLQKQAGVFVFVDFDLELLS